MYCCKLQHVCDAGTRAISVRQTCPIQPPAVDPGMDPAALLTGAKSIDARLSWSCVTSRVPNILHERKSLEGEQCLSQCDRQLVATAVAHTGSSD